MRQIGTFAIVLLVLLGLAAGLYVFYQWRDREAVTAPDAAADATTEPQADAREADEAGGPTPPDSEALRSPTDLAPVAVGEDRQGPTGADTGAPGAGTSAAGTTAAGDDAAEVASVDVRPAPVETERAPATAESGEPPPAGEAVTPPSFDVVRISQECTAVIAGRAAPGAAVDVVIGDDVIGTVTADDRGQWVLVYDGILPPGTQQVRLVAESAEHGRLTSTRDVVLVMPDCKAPAEERDSAIAVLTPAPGTKAEVGETRVLQSSKPAGEDSDLSVAAVDYDEAGNVSVAGTAEPGTRVQAYVDEKLVGEAETTEQGDWRLVPDETVEPGVYKLRVDQVDSGGEVMARIELPFSRARPDDLIITADRIIVQPGNSLWRIARRTYGQGVLYTVIYQANRAYIRDPDLIYPGQVFRLPTPSDELQAN